MCIHVKIYSLCSETMNKIETTVIACTLFPYFYLLFVIHLQDSLTTDSRVGYRLPY